MSTAVTTGSPPWTTTSDEDEGPAEGLREWASEDRPTPQIAERLESTTDPADRSFLAQHLVHAWVGLCNPVGGISSLSGEAVSEEELRWVTIRTTEQLDLDHLSPEMGEPAGPEEEL